jgi:hypothetical protein
MATMLRLISYYTPCRFLTTLSISQTYSTITFPFPSASTVNPKLFCSDTDFRPCRPSSVDPLVDDDFRYGFPDESRSSNVVEDLLKREETRLSRLLDGIIGIQYDGAKEACLYARETEKR